MMDLKSQKRKKWMWATMPTAARKMRRWRPPILSGPGGLWPMPQPARRRRLRRTRAATPSTRYLSRVAVLEVHAMLRHAHAA